MNITRQLVWNKEEKYHIYWNVEMDGFSLSTNDKEEQYWQAVGCRPCVFTQVKSQQH